jgi:aminoglycoside 3-N-acetyltransferase
MLDKYKFKQILSELGINQNDLLLVNSNMLNILIRNKKFINIEKIIDALTETVTNNGTVMFPAYNWDFCKGENFDLKKTKSYTGSLSNLSLSRKDFQRSINPIYSFSIFGKNQEYIASLEHESCFNLDSPFGYLINNKGKNLFIDLDYKLGLTIVHVAEEFIGVDYRYFKTFLGDFINLENKKKKVSFQMYVRDLNKAKSTVIDDKFDEVLENNNAIKKINFEGISFCCVDLEKTFKLMCEELKNKNSLIYPELVLKK